MKTVKRSSKQFNDLAKHILLAKLLPVDLCAFSVVFRGFQSVIQLQQELPPVSVISMNQQEEIIRLVTNIN